MNNYNLISSINKLGICLFESNLNLNSNPNNLNISNIVIFQNHKFIINLNQNLITFFELGKLFSENIFIEISEFIKIPITFPNTKTIISENWMKPLNPNHIIIFFLSKYVREINNNQIKEVSNNNKDKKKIKKPKMKSIPLALKRKVWDHWVGEQIGKTKCPCCKLTDITQLNFSCGHIKAEANGGILHVLNLRPVCVSCNSSMGTKNMNEFISEYGL